jgi:glutamate dehydrogenase
MRALEKAGKLDRAIEFLPDDEALAEREARREGLTRLELSVLLAYGKITLFEELLSSDVPDDPYSQQELWVYFPEPLREQFKKEMQEHPLRREIIATYITNSVLNRMGSTFMFRLMEETGESYPNIAGAYAAVREMFRARRLWSAIGDLDNQVPASRQIDMLIIVQRLLARASLWLLRHRRSPLDIERVVNHFSPGIIALEAEFPRLLETLDGVLMRQTCQELIEGGVPEDLARTVASLDALYSGLDLVEISTQTGLPVTVIAGVYFDLAGRLELNWLAGNIAELETANHWQNRARSALLNSLYDQARLLTADVLTLTPDEENLGKRLDAWMKRNRSGIERCHGIFADLRAAGQPDLAMLSVALREISNLVQGVEA